MPATYVADPAPRVEAAVQELKFRLVRFETKEAERGAENAGAGVHRAARRTTERAAICSMPVRQDRPSPQAYTGGPYYSRSPPGDTERPTFSPTECPRGRKGRRRLDRHSQPGRLRQPVRPSWLCP